MFSCAYFVVQTPNLRVSYIEYLKQTIILQHISGLLDLSKFRSGFKRDDTRGCIFPANLEKTEVLPVGPKVYTLYIGFQLFLVYTCMYPVQWLQFIEQFNNYILLQ